jgi:hypothetical protein
MENLSPTKETGFWMTLSSDTRNVKEPIKFSLPYVFKNNYSTPFEHPPQFLPVLTCLDAFNMLRSNLESRSDCSIRLFSINYSEKLLPRSILLGQRSCTDSAVTGRDQRVFREGYYLSISILTWTLKSSPKRRWRLRNKRLRSTYEVGTICSFQWDRRPILESVDGLGVCRELPSVSVSDDAGVIILWRNWSLKKMQRGRGALNRREGKGKWTTSSGERGGFPDFLIKLCLR